MARSYRDAAIEAQRARVRQASDSYAPPQGEAQGRLQTGLYRPGSAQATTLELRNPNAPNPADAQAEQQMAMQSQLSPQEYAVLQNLLSEADRWHGTNEGGERVFTGQRGMSPDEMDRLRRKGGRVQMVSPKAAARDDAREEARRQQAARAQERASAREQARAEQDRLRYTAKWRTI